MKPDLVDALGKIHLGDCIAGMNDLPAGSIDLVFADPPFNIGYEYDAYDDSREYDEYLAWSKRWIGAIHRVLQPNGTFWLAIGDEYAAELKIASVKQGFHLRSWVVWYYTFGVNCKSKFSRSHVHLFYFVKNKDKFTFRFTEPENRVPSARMLVYGDRRSNPEGRLPDDTWILRPQDLIDCFTPNEDTWYIPRVAGTFKERQGFHGCQMPEQLLGRIIRSCTHEGDTVLDPFSGSATTLAVAKKLNRQHLGFDLSSEYVTRGTNRLTGVFVGDPLEGAPEPMMTAPRSVKPRRGTRSINKEPLEEILEASAAARQKHANAIFEEGLLEAYRRVYNGFSLDRVIADPELNTAFAEQCSRIGVLGDIRAWNRHLLRVRKAGKLSQLLATRRTEFSWEDCDSFLFASEIAWKTLLGQGHKGLDDILSDPAVAAEFDAIASSYAPGSRSLAYRWAALKLRKEANRAQTRARHFAPGDLRLSESFDVEATDFPSVPDTSGVYLVTKFSNGSSRHLYAGEAFRLQSRFTQQFQPSVLKNWTNGTDQLKISFFEVDRNAQLLLAYQSLCIQAHKPLLNFPERLTA